MEGVWRMKRRILSCVLALLMLISTVPLSPQIFATEEATTNPTGVSDEMIAVLKKMEGFMLYPVWDYKQYSVGYGTRCPDDKYAEYMANGIPESDAEQLLRDALKTFETKLNNHITDYNLTLTQNQYDALVSFTYNCGAGWMSETQGNLFLAVKDGDTGARLIYSMILWSKASNEFVLLSRRIAELNMFLYGVYDAYEQPDNLRYVFLDGAGGKTSYVVHGFDTNIPTPVLTGFKSCPTGPDENGDTVTYLFDGWYTEREGGTRVDQLDENIAKGEVLYAHWKLPSGTQVVVPEPDDGVQLTVTVQKNNVPIYKGNQKYYAEVRQVNTGDTVVISEVASVGSKLWGKVFDGWIRLDGGYTDYSAVKKALMPMSGTVTGDIVNVRKGAGSSYEALTTLKEGDVVSIKDWKTDGSSMWGSIDVEVDGETVTGWISLEYVYCDKMEKKTVTGVSMAVMPSKVEYLQMNEMLEVNGGQIRVEYSDGSSKYVNITADMVTGFDNATVGTNTLTVTYGDLTTTFDVEITKATVTFQYEDGTVISAGQYLYGEEVIPPAEPTKQADEKGTYRFIGWDKEVEPCTGNTIYTAQFELVTIAGDVNRDGVLNDLDATQLLFHYFFPEDYEAFGELDMNGDGMFNDLDATYLLFHYFFPEDYPLYPVSN